MGIFYFCVWRNNSPGSSQKLAFIYKTSRITNISSQALLTNLHPFYNGGNESFVADFPTGSPSQFWASGRMPYMLRADVNINGSTERVYFINIHAKASGGSTNRARRRYDVEELKDYIDGSLGTQNVIFLGDYNDQVDYSNSPYNNYFNDNASNPGSDGEYYDVLTRQLDINGENTFVGGSSFLDHITITDELTDNYVAGSITVHNEVVTSDYTSTTTDHIPVSAQFNFGTLAARSTTASQSFFVTQTENIQIFPNPSPGQINIEVEEKADAPILMAIFDLNGTLLLKQTLKNSKEQVDLSSFTKDGMYILRVIQGDKVTTKKIILER